MAAARPSRRATAPAFISPERAGPNLERKIARLRCCSSRIRRARRMREEQQRSRAIFRSRLGPARSGLMNAGAVARREGRAAATD